MTKNDIITKLAQEKESIETRFKLKIKGIFGSYARGDESEKSDIDILVEFEKGASLLDMIDIGNYLEEKLNNKVDIVSERALRNELKPYVYKDLIAIWIENTNYI